MSSEMMYNCIECGEGFNSLVGGSECPECGQKYVFPPVEDEDEDDGEGSQDLSKSVSRKDENQADKRDEQKGLLWAGGK